MSNIFNGLGAAQAIINMANESQDRKNRQQREKNIAAAGQVAARGDMGKASEMLMSTGDIDGAMAFENIANRRQDRAIEAEERDLIRSERARTREREDAASALLSEVFGGPQTGDAYQAAASQMAPLNPEMAADLMRTGGQMSAEQSQAFAQELVSGFAAAPKGERAKAMKSMAEQFKADLDPDIYEMMTNDDPSDDLRAAIQWGVRNGADVSALEGELAVEVETRARERIMRLQSRLDAQERAAKAGQSGTSPYHYSSENLESSERRVIMTREAKMLEEADAATKQAEDFAAAADRFVNYAVNNDVDTSAMGRGAEGWRVRNRQGLATGKWDALAGIAEEMVRMTRVPGSGVFTDADADRAQKSVLGAKKDWQDNLDARDFAKKYARHVRGRSDFLRWARDTYGHAGGMDSPEARYVWEQYRDANPLTAENGNRVELNPYYVDFSTWRMDQIEKAEAQRRRDADAQLSADDLRSQLDREIAPRPNYGGN